MPEKYRRASVDINIVFEGSWKVDIRSILATVLYIIYHQVLEEEVVEAYRRMVDGLEVWRQQDVILLDMTNTVDYDQGAYAQLLEEMVGEKQEVLADLALKAKAFR